VPNATVAPRRASPVVRPLNILRNLTRFGASISRFPPYASEEYVEPRRDSTISPLKTHTFTPIVPNVVFAVDVA